jgi:hypothetical protein
VFDHKGGIFGQTGGKIFTGPSNCDQLKSGGGTSTGMGCRSSLKIWILLLGLDMLRQGANFEPIREQITSNRTSPP